MTNITLEADGDEEGVSIQCIGEAGLAFINVSYLSIRNITVDGCGFTGSDINSTVDILGDIVNIFYVIPRVVRIAVLIGHCENMTIESVTIKNTRGFGLVGINVIGNSLLSDVVFFNNTKTGVCRSHIDCFIISVPLLTTTIAISWEVQLLSCTLTTMIKHVTKETSSLLTYKIATSPIMQSAVLSI